VPPTFLHFKAEYDPIPLGQTANSDAERMPLNVTSLYQTNVCLIPEQYVPDPKERFPCSDNQGINVLNRRKTADSRRSNAAIFVSFYEISL
jgi:hypothetical protein